MRNEKIDCQMKFLSRGLDSKFVAPFAADVHDGRLTCGYLPEFENY